MELNKETDFLSHYTNNATSCNKNVSTSDNVDSDSEHSFVCKQTVSEIDDIRNPSLSRKRADAGAVQEINIVTIDDSDRTCNYTDDTPFTCFASVSTESKGKRKTLESNEYITAAMFKSFMDSHNEQMEFVRNSIQLLSDSFYEEEYYEDDEDNYDSEEEEPPKKRTRSDNVIFLILMLLTIVVAINKTHVQHTLLKHR